MKVFVCKSCSVEGNFVEEVRVGLREVDVVSVDCMSGCERAQTIAFRSPGKVAYLFGDITTADMDDLRNFVRLYLASEDGTFPDARVLGNLRTKAIARIPG